MSTEHRVSAAELEEIERVAKTADAMNPSPWDWNNLQVSDASGRDLVDVDICGTDEMIPDTGTYIAKMDPTTTLRLIARIRELENRIQHCRRDSLLFCRLNT